MMPIAPENIPHVTVVAGSPILQFLQDHRTQVVAFVAGFGLILLVFELVRRYEIKERYSFLWFVTGLSITVLAGGTQLLAKVAKLLGIYYPPAALFLVLIFFMILILIHFSMVISGLITQNQKLAQKIALLEADVKLQKNKDQDRAA